MRVVVIGTSGAGKSRFARALASRQQCACIELDSLYWMPGWTPRPIPEFTDLVRSATAGDCWVADGNYSAVRSALWGRATHIVWLNYSRTTVFTREIRRTLWRALTRPTLWAGNRESLRMTFLSKESILWWAFSTYDQKRAEFSALSSGAEFRHLQWIEFRHPSQAEAFLETLK